MKENSSLPILGARLPKLEVVTTHGKMVLPDELAGKWFMLFSHPADFTPVCTTEFVALADYYDEFLKVNTELVGLSVDAVTAHLKWTEWIKDNIGVEIKFPIIADSLGDVAKKLGMIHEAKGTDTVRSVFIVDDKGDLRITMHYPQEAGRNVEELLRIIKALQYSDKNKVAMPENWPNNARLGSDVIIPPATTEQLIVKRKKEMKDNPDYDYKDWWFISKKIK
ncbi:MAG TPA: peroxiredoxin [Bacilli bacterium]|nr:peroxiredoxin [Bacilli bacterium]